MKRWLSFRFCFSALIAITVGVNPVALLRWSIQSGAAVYLTASAQTVWIVIPRGCHSTPLAPSRSPDHSNLPATRSRHPSPRLTVWTRSHWDERHCLGQ